MEKKATVFTCTKGKYDDEHLVMTATFGPDSDWTPAKLFHMALTRHCQEFGVSVKEVDVYVGNLA